MFEVFKWQVGDLLAFGLILLRISACVVTMPILGAKLVPGPLKVLMSLLLTLTLFPILAKTVPPAIDWDATTIVYALREVGLGIFLGFLARMMFIAVDVAGQLMSATTGLSTAAIVNPTFGESVTSLEEFQSNLVMLLFLALNGHHFFFEALLKSFVTAPIGVLTLSPTALLSVGALAQDILSMGVQLAGPLIAITLVLNLGQGIVGRVVPQINVFVTSLQVNIMVGLFVFMAMIPFLMSVVELGFSDMSLKILSVVELF